MIINTGLNFDEQENLSIITWIFPTKNMILQTKKTPKTYDLFY